MEMDENSVGLILAIHEQTQKKKKKKKKKNEINSYLQRYKRECNDKSNSQFLQRIFLIDLK